MLSRPARSGDDFRPAGEGFGDPASLLDLLARADGWSCIELSPEIRTDGLVPIWGAGSDNHASLRVAAKLGFSEVTRLVFLVPTER